jgi:DNA-directed RNA polymerase subunit alpha
MIRVYLAGLCLDVSVCLHNIAHILLDERDDSVPQPGPQTPVRAYEGMNPALFMQCNDLDVSTRARTCMCNCKPPVSLVGDLVQRTEKEILCTHNLGKRTLYELIDALAAHGLEFCMDVPNWDEALRQWKEDNVR